MTEHELDKAGVRNLRQLSRQAGYHDRDVATVPALRCRSSKTAAPNMRQLRACRPFLLHVLEVLNPRQVVALGGNAGKALLDRGSVSITGLRGRNLEVPDVPGVVRVSYDPKAISRGATHLRQRIIADLVQLRNLDNQLALTFAVPTGKLLAVDSEYAPDGTLLTLALADATRAQAWDVDDLTLTENNTTKPGMPTNELGP